MTMLNDRERYRQALEKDFASLKVSDHDLTRLEFLGDYIFRFVTYDSEMAQLFAQKAIEVCLAINNQTTFKYIEEQDNYKWFLIMMNMPFFDGKLSWGVFLRGAWWEGPTDEDINLWTGLLSMKEALSEMEDDSGIGLDFTVKQWREFIEVLAEFAMNS